MCINLIKVPNQRIGLDERYHRLFNYVPCGKCWQCQQSRSLGYQTRAIAEYLDTTYRGGDTYYYTLTYNNEHLPKFFSTPCFSKRDVQLFFKRLRKCINQSFTFKYFLTSEYGGNTHRPHYHFLLFTDRHINPTLLRYYIELCWYNGFIKAGKNQGLVNSVAACSYVAKYVCKEDDFVSKFPTDLSNECKKRFFPFHLQSHHFGECICSLIDNDNLVKNKFILHTDNGPKEYNIPLYITRKLLYDVVKSDDGKVLYRLNKRGFTVKYKQLDERLKTFCSDVRDLISRPMSFYTSICPDFSNIDSNDILSESDLYPLAVYSICARAKFKYSITANPHYDYISQFFTHDDFIPPVKDVHKYAFYDSRYERLLCVVEKMKSIVAYYKYKESIESYNVAQNILFMEHKEFKHTKDLLTYNEFIKL